MRLLIKGGRVVDPASGRDALGDVFVADGRIAPPGGTPERTIDAKGLVVAPGLIDLAARLREPGYEHKATLESEMDAAVAGGVTSLACPPDTDPPLDEPGLVDMLRRRANEVTPRLGVVRQGHPQYDASLEVPRGRQAERPAHARSCATSLQPFPSLRSPSQGQLRCRRCPLQEPSRRRCRNDGVWCRRKDDQRKAIHAGDVPRHRRLWHRRAVH